MSKGKRLDKQDYVGVLSSVFAIIIGLLVGLIIPLICNPSQAFPGFIIILTGAFTHGLKGVGQMFYYVTPIILTRLSVGFALKTGLFNIGTPGRFIVGTFAVAYVRIICGGLGSVHWIAALSAAVLGGAVWGLVPGLLEAYFSVNEVIASIMMNYIGMYMVNWITEGYRPLLNDLRNESKNVAVTVQIPKMGMNKLFPESSVNGGILIAAVTAFLIWIILNKTTFGFELKAVGFNRDANKYTGINEKKSIVMNMVIAGAITGMAGGLLYLASTGKHIEIKDVLASEGFTGVSVALLGLGHPTGVLSSRLFITHLTAGGFYLQLFEFSTEVIDIIMAVIIYLSTFALIVKTILSRIHRSREKRDGQA